MISHTNIYKKSYLNKRAKYALPSFIESNKKMIKNPDGIESWITRVVNI